jgi:hypothetical protein
MPAFTRLIVLTAIGLALSPSFAALQGLGTVAGRLVDPNGNTAKGLEDTSIRLTNTATKQELTATVSQASGEFTVANVPPGMYDVAIPIACCLYRSFAQKAVTIKAGEVLRLDAQLEWGMNLGTIADDPGILGSDMRARAGKVTGPTPRTPDGKVDFSGVWSFIRRAGGGGGPARPPLKPWAAEIQKKLQEMNVDQNAAAYCLPQTAVPTMLTYPQKFVQGRTTIIQLADFFTPGYRQIFIDGRGHPADWNPSWLGHSVGTWDGDTLVVETVGFNEITPGFGIHSEKLRVVERFQRPDLGRLRVDIVAEDPEAWTGPLRSVAEAVLTPDEEVLEWVCAENNKDPLHFGGLAWRGRP